MEAERELVAGSALHHFESKAVRLDKPDCDHLTFDPAERYTGGPEFARYNINMAVLTAEDRARRIKLILFDVDGVLTDGSIWVFPIPATFSGGAAPAMVEPKGFNAHDGVGITLARLGGMKCGVITRRTSETVAIRARDLKLEYVYMGQSHKMRAVREIVEKEGISLEEMAYVGDDVVDLPVMRQVGLAIAVDNAREQVKSEAHHVTPHRGGDGAGRDAIEFILKAKGVLSQVIEQYIDEDHPIAKAVDIGKGSS
jgi:3-deoxy-D-manno-octulosonate 8-phosphate phosphatase (KDO 8-P phosphatase)